MAIELEPFWQRLRDLEAGLGTASPANPNDAAKLAAANRAARVAKFGEDMVTKMEAAGSRFAPGGAAVSAPRVAPVSPSGFGARAMQTLRTPITARGVVRGVGGALKSAVTSPLTYIPVGVSALASRMSGGDWGNVATAAMDPRLPVRALAERYADLAPEFMGGLSPESIAAGRAEGASDIGGDFDARMVPDLTGRAPTRVPSVMGSGYGAEVSPGMRSFGQESISRPDAPLMPNQAESTPGGGRMVKFRDPQTGNWTYTDTATPGGIPEGMVTTPVMDRVSVIGDQGGAKTPEQWRAEGRAADFRMAEADRLRGRAAGESYIDGAGVLHRPGEMVRRTQYETPEAEMLANARYAVENAPNNRAAAIAQKRVESLEQAGAARATAEASGRAEGNKRIMDQAKLQFDYDKLIADIAGKGPAERKTMLENLSLEQRITLASMEPDRIKRAAILAGNNPPVDSFGEMTTMLPDKSGAVPMRNNRTGEITMVSPTPAQRTATKADFEADVKRLGSKDMVLREYARRNITPPKE